MLEKAVENLRKYLPKDTKFAVAVSGGVDSMTLLHLLTHTGMYDKKDILVLNVEHGIRGENSKNDSAFVRNYCAEEEIRFKGYTVNIPQLAKSSGRGLEHEARLTRYAIFRDVMAGTDHKKVLVAHHANDNTESVLMHLLRGAGIGGICGMKMDDGEIFRPLLDCYRDEILAYAAEQKVPFITDESNALIDYDRNYLRNEIMPRLKSRWPGCEKAIAQLSKGAEEMWADTLNVLNYDNLDLEKADKGIVRLRYDCLKAYVSTRYIFTALAHLNVTDNIYSKHLTAIRMLCASNNGSQIDIGQGITVIKEYDYLTFINKIGQKSACKREVEFCAGEFGVNGLTVSCKTLSVGEANAQAATMKKQGAFSVKNGRFQMRPLLLDYNKVPQGSVMRKRLSGDLFAPFGGKGVKKLKEYLIDKKIPLRLRDKLPCLCYNNCILAVFGVEIAESVKVDMANNSKPLLITVTGELQ